MLKSVGLQRIRHDLVTEQQQQNRIGHYRTYEKFAIFVLFKLLIMLYFFLFLVKCIVIFSGSPKSSNWVQGS